jgi:hypothetical protein
MNASFRSDFISCGRYHYCRGISLVRRSGDRDRLIDLPAEAGSHELQTTGVGKTPSRGFRLQAEDRLATLNP